MKENAKLVLPKIAPFNEEDESDVPATLKEDEESKTRSHRKRKAKVKSLSENLPRISSSGKLNLTCLGVRERDASVPSERKENNATHGPAVNVAANPFLPSCMSPSKFYRTITVTGQKTLFDRPELALPESDLARAQKMMTWSAVPWIFPQRKRAGAADLACLLLITRAQMRTRLPRVAIEGWVPDTVAVPTFHCRKCLTHWRACGELPQECNEPEETVEGPPMYITGKANFGRKMPIQNAYTAGGSQLQICIDVTVGRQSRASDADLGALDTTDEVDADTLWDLRPNDLDRSGSDDSALDDNVQFLSHSHMSTGGHGSLASDATATQLPPIVAPSNISGTTQMTCATSVTGRQSVLAGSLDMQGGDCPLSTHGNSHHKHGTHKGGHSGQGSKGSYSDHASSADGGGCSVSAVAQGSRTDQHGGRMGKNEQGTLTGNCKSGSYGDGSYGDGSYGDGSYGDGSYGDGSYGDGGVRTVGRRGDDGATSSKSRDYIEGGDTTRYGTAQEQGTRSPHPLQGSGHGAKRSSDRKGGNGAMNSNGPSPGNGPASLSTAGRNRSSALAEGDDLVGSIGNGNASSSARNQQSLRTSSNALSPQSVHDRSTSTGKHEGPTGGRSEQSRRPEHQKVQSPASSRLRSTMSTVEPSHSPAGDPGYGTASGQGQPRAQEKRVVHRATIKENVEYVPDKVGVGKKKKAQLKKGIRPTDSSQTTSNQVSAVTRRGSYLLAQASSQNGMHQIDTSKLEEQRQSGVGAPPGSTATPRTLRNATKSRDVSVPTRHNSKNLDEVLHQSPDLYRNKRRPSLQHTDINPSSESDSHGQRVSSGWRERGDLQKGQTSSRLLAKEQDMLGTDAATATTGGVSTASNAKNQDKKLPFSHGTDSGSSAVQKFLQQQSQALDSTVRRSSSATKQPSALQDQYLSKGKAVVGTQVKASTASTGTGTASACESEGTTSAQVEAKVSNRIGSNDSLGAISEASEGDEALAELEYYNSVRPSGFNLMSVMNFTTRSFTYSMFPMSKQHKESYDATHITANTTNRRQIKRTAVKS